MKNKFIVILIFGIAMITAVLSLWYVYNQRSDAVLEQSSLRLVVVKSSGQSFGSAVIFDQDQDYYYALTNEHVIRDASTIDALDYEQERYAASIVARSSSRDLAIIKIDKSNRLKVLSIARDYEINQEIKAVGYPSSIFSITSGVISDVEDISDDLPIDIIVHTAIIDHGSSGGAIVNDRNQIIGINYAGYFDEGELLHSYAIPLEDIQSFLEASNYDA